MKTQGEALHRITNVVVTRSKEGNAQLATRLVASGFKVTMVETMRFLPPESWEAIDMALKGLSSYDWLVFTSAVGAGGFLGRMRELSLSLEWGSKPDVAAIGEKTKEALVRQGARVSFVPSEFLSKALAMELPVDRGRRVLVLRADIADPGLVDDLEQRGFQVHDLAIYRTILPSRKVAKEELLGADAIIFASPSAVRGFVSAQGPETIKSMNNVLAACIGPVTAEAARKAGFERVFSSSAHTLDGLLEGLRTLDKSP